MVLITGVVCVAVSCKKDDTIPPRNAVNAAAIETVQTTGISLPENTPSNPTDVSSSETTSPATIDLSNETSSDRVPLLLQTDERWSEQSYAGSTIGKAGCGPTCLSMAGIYLTGNGKYTPAYVAEYADQNGYSSEGEGTNWTLISNGASYLGLTSAEIPKNKTVMTRLASCGVPIICAVGPGTFTKEGHYIVITGTSDGKFTVNDPNSTENSSKTYSYEEIESQIRNAWAIWGERLNCKEFVATQSGINIRNDSSLDSRVERLSDETKKFKLDNIVNNGGYVWGHMDDGNWICMSYVKKA